MGVFSKLHFCKMTINILFRVLGIQIIIILECVDLCLPTFLVTAAFALHSSYSALLPTLFVPQHPVIQSNAEIIVSSLLIINCCLRSVLLCIKYYIISY